MQGPTTEADPLLANVSTITLCCAPSGGPAPKCTPAPDDTVKTESTEAEDVARRTALRVAVCVSRRCCSLAACMAVRVMAAAVITRSKGLPLRSRNASGVVSITIQHAAAAVRTTTSPCKSKNSNCPATTTCAASQCNTSTAPAKQTKAAKRTFTARHHSACTAQLPPRTCIVENRPNSNADTNGRNVLYKRI